MADTELVIKIPEGIMEYIKNNGCLSVFYIDEVAKAIKNSKPFTEYIAEYIDKAFDDLGKCKCGSSYIIIDGEEYRTDIGYAFEGIELFMNYIKGTLSKEKWEE
jgi:hypothetical protein